MYGSGNLRSRSSNQGQRENSVNIDFNDIAEQFSNLDPENIGNWPVLVRSLIIVLASIAVLGGVYYFDTQQQLQSLERSQRNESSLKSTFEKKQAKAASLDAYKNQMKEMEESFGTMLRQLPSKTEVADLLVDITQTGLASGLEFDLFQPQPEAPKEFYAELPIDIKVKGNYHQLGEFVSGIAALPRIVTIHNINIKSERGAAGQQTSNLIMEAVAKTYRYLDEEEIAAAKKKDKKKRR
jgi:type IV pilus assembly protein PilO